MDWDKIAEEYLAVAQLVFGPLREQIDAVADEMAASIEKGGKILICGNGGSAGDAQHFSGELVNRFLKERRPYAGVALTTDTSVMTAISNDYSYDQVFAKQVEALAQPGDVLVGISTSGKAANVNLAVDKAKELGVLTVALTGGEGGELVKRVDRVLSISCTSAVPRIQEGHGLIIHALCERIEEKLG